MKTLTVTECPSRSTTTRLKVYKTFQPSSPLKVPIHFHLGLWPWCLRRGRHVKVLLIHLFDVDFADLCSLSQLRKEIGRIPKKSMTTSHSFEHSDLALPKTCSERAFLLGPHVWRWRWYHHHMQRFAGHLPKSARAVTELGGNFWGESGFVAFW